MRSFVAAAMGIAAIAAASSANAATVYTLGAPTGAMDLPATVNYNFNAGAGAGTVDFVVRGYNTLDGVNCCTDVFSFSVNGTELFKASFDLGGGGANVVYTAAPVGSSVSVVNGANGTITASILTSFLNGSNTLTFAYSGGMQGLGDEGWGINSVVATGNAVSAAVPEPTTWAFMILGFGAVGGAMRSRSTKVAYA